MNRKILYPIIEKELKQLVNEYVHVPENYVVPPKLNDVGLIGALLLLWTHIQDVKFHTSKCLSFRTTRPWSLMQNVNIVWASVVVSCELGFHASFVFASIIHTRKWNKALRDCLKDLVVTSRLLDLVSIMSIHVLIHWNNLILELQLSI